MFRRALFAGPLTPCHVVAVTFILSAFAFAQTETVLQNFSNSGTLPYAPASNLIFDAAGNLYGTTAAGGTYGGGTVFELMPQTGAGWTARLLHSFNPATDGSGPGTLIFDASGNLYGVNSGGGADNVGTVFELVAQVGGGWRARLLHSFKNDGIDGQTPVAALTFDTAGNLYGVTGFGGSENPERAAHNGQRIEIQIRSRLQNAWATAVEVVGAFRKQALKSGQGSKEWQRLLTLMSSVFALKEQRPLVPNTPGGASLFQEIKSLSDEIKAEQFLAGCSEAAVHIEKSMKRAMAYLMVLDVKERKVQISPQDSMLVANEKYAEMERKNRDAPQLQTVLVSVDSLGALRTAYPNYYLDVSEFLKELRALVIPYRIVFSNKVPKPPAGPPEAP